MDEKYFEEANLIPKDELLEHVSLSVLRSTAIGLPGIADWKSGGVKKEPLEIYDINGKLLFFDYTIKKGTEILGTVRACASKILGSPVIAHELGQRFWDHEAAIKKLIPKVKREYPRQKILSTKLVCYSYPKLGVMFELADEQAKRSRLIFDVADLSPIPEKPPKPGLEGAYAWSFYDSLPEDARKLRLKRFDSFYKWRAEVPAKKLKELRVARTLLPYVEAIKWPFKLFATKQLQFCPHYNYNETRSHHCFVLHGQQKNDYCAVATAQMILCYYRYYYTQDQIAPALGYGPGGCPSDQSAGYEQLSCNHLDATYDTSPTWEEARDQINALHPLKSGIPGHARACAGYSHMWWLFPIKQMSLYIYDPWPWNVDYKLGGAVYWEDWDSLTHTNYVFTRILCPAD
jgi:hypothetical protein